tara:strand:- start:1235 stop:1408 length:174 start_codon:yes stop_codon:yes gene_type:complete
MASIDSVLDRMFDDLSARCKKYRQGVADHISGIPYNLNGCPIWQDGFLASQLGEVME